jgi:hypothetical protein
LAYTPTEWTNREVEKPRTYIMTDNLDGTITLTPSEGQIFTPGTPLDATNLNKMEDQIALNDTNLAGKVDKAGDTLTGPLTGTVINATTALQEAGVNLSTKYQAKGSFAPSGQYATWDADPNGCSVVVGKFNGTGKPIRVFFTTAQPSASNAEHRVWIQIDWQV